MSLSWKELSKLSLSPAPCSVVTTESVALTVLDSLVVVVVSLDWPVALPDPALMAEPSLAELLETLVPLPTEESVVTTVESLTLADVVAVAEV